MTASYLAFIPSSRPPPPAWHSNLTFSPNFSSPSRLIGARRSFCRCLRGGGGGGGSSWDSNAESVRAERFKFRDGGGGGEQDEGDSWGSSKRQWWSDDSSDELGEDFDTFDDDPIEQDPWDMIWIFKVFKAYGYLLPAIILSMLLATGPKAFLMALAVPLGQSAISLVLDKVRGKVPGGPRTKSNKKPFTRSNADYRRQWRHRSSYNNHGKNGHHSWVSMDAGVSDGVKTDGTSLGGWDELDCQGASTNGYARQQPSTLNGSPKNEPAKKGKLSKRGRYKDAPLFLRLLIAVFPFLGSWTRIFW